MKLLNKVLKISTYISALALFGAYLSVHINPQHIIWLSFLGLGFPIILSVNFILFLYWLFKRKMLLILPLVMIIAGAKYINSFVQMPFVNEKRIKNRVKNVKDSVNIMSYNVRLFDLYNWTENKETRNKIFTQIEKEQPDIICFQEFYRADDKKFITKDTLTKFLKANQVFEGFTHEMRGGRYFGVATFSKYPIVNAGKASFTNDANNNFILTDLLINGDTVRVINAHVGSVRFQQGDYNYIGGKGNSRFYPWQEVPDSLLEQKIIDRLKLAYAKRSKQVNQIRKEIKNSPYPVILCGDFNDIPISYAYGRLSSVLNDAFTQCGKGMGGTYIGNVPGLRIDYIMHSEKFKAVEFKTHPEELSDHRAISTKLYQLK